MSVVFVIYLTIILGISSNANCVSYNNWLNKKTDSSNDKNNQLLFSKVCQSGIREDNTNYIYCARKSLTKVPIFSKNNVVYDELVLADNRITELHANSFSRIKVKKIFLNGNPLRYIDQMTFSKLENHLTELWIDGDTTISSNNLLAEPLYTTSGGLPKAIVHYLRSLDTLHIKGFMVHTLTNGILKKLKRIEILSLKFCSIEKIESFAFEGLDKSLKELYLDGNLMQSVPSTVLLTTKFQSLRVLSLAQNRIKIINEDSFGSALSYLNIKADLLSTLNKLDLSYNGLKKVHPNAFKNMNGSLETLKMQNNEINSFNLEFLKNLGSLDELNLAFNVITALPMHTFLRSSHLKILELQGNSIEFTPSANEFTGLNNLHKLNLARNSIKHLPDNLFRTVSSLQGLNLDKNPIESLNPTIFTGLYQNLKNLSMQSTEFKSLELASLKKFKNLARIKLNHNQMTELDLSIFDASRTTLTNLDARQNHIKYIHHSSNNKLEKLIEFDLSNNELCGYNSDLLSIVPNLKNLGLTQNPLYCDCDLLPLFEWSQKNFDADIISFIQWQCEVPQENNNGHVSYRQFTSLTSNEFKCLNNVTSKCKQNVQKGQRYVQPTSTTEKMKSQTHYLKDIKKIYSQSKIANVLLNINDMNSIDVKWSIDSESSKISGFKITFSEPDSKSPMLKSFTVADSTKRDFKLQNLKYNTKYSICVSIVQYEGYDKYCRDIKTTERIKTLEVSTKRSEDNKLTTKLTATSDLLKNSKLIPTLMIALLSVLIIFIVGLIVFIYIYIKKCRSNKKNQPSAKSLMLSGSSTNSAIMSSRSRPSGYQGPKLTTLEASKKMIDIKKGGESNCNKHHQIIIGSSSSSSPQSTSTISNPNFCSCLHMNNGQTSNTMGRQFVIGDTSTVSSTLSTENNNNSNSSQTKVNPNYNVHLLAQEIENFNNNEMYNREILRTVPQSSDLISSSPTSFQHFTLPHNNQMSYMPYEVYNQSFNPNLLHFNGNNNNNNNSTLHYDKLSKLNKIILSNNNTNNSDHVYCEIPPSSNNNMGQPTLGRINRNQQFLLNSNNQGLNYYNNNLNNIHQHLVNQSLLMATSSTNDHTGVSSFGTNKNNANNSNLASII